jgi:transcriptional regulator of arginine metabolism
LREFLLEIRAAQNLLVLRTPPGGAQPLAAALDAERIEGLTGTIAGDDTVLVITPSRRARLALEKRIGGMLA